ncbi:MAG: hypothetical protein KatS3mg096_694 [Candidatus Parcubacteria bacterium]|nr:MAG: hypothetical protein KatS3mg096_667 [Candidatus Parcubacteria bacterium]GIW67826.1 MAG: hypothetical protein KatS3mg096_694 [Candidatus Parcubacteria bacterium]
MTLSDFLIQTIVQTISNLISNSAWFILFYLGFKMITKEIKKFSKEIPLWIENYHKKQLERIRIQEALNMRRMR